MGTHSAVGLPPRRGRAPRIALAVFTVVNGEKLVSV
jgi:hypothetical protein